MVGLDFKLPPEEQITAAAINPVDRIGWPDRTGKHITEANDTVRQAIYQGIVQGNSYDGVARELRDALNITASKAERIVRTESHRAREVGNLAATVEAAEMGINMKRRWLATLDGRTRDTHGAMDGQEIEVFDEEGNLAKFRSPEGGETEYPGGFGIAREDINCRCSTIDVVEGYEPTTRRARDEFNKGEVIPYTNFTQYAQAKGWATPYAGAEPRVVDRYIDLAKMSEDDANTYLKKLVDDQSKELTTEELKAIKGYTGADYTPINDHLRGGQTHRLTPKNKKAIKSIDGAFTKTNPLSDDLIVHRNGGMGRIMSREEFLDDALSEKRLSELIGSTIKDDGFISTTTHGDLVGKIKTGQVKYDVVLPQGSNAHLPVGSISFTPYENEILLNRGSVFVVEKAEIVYENKGVKFMEKRYLHVVLRLIK